jgi:hypothetical protein
MAPNDNLRGIPWSDYDDYSAPLQRKEVKLPQSGAKNDVLGGIDWKQYRGKGTVPGHAALDARIETVKGVSASHPMSSDYRVVESGYPEENNRTGLSLLHKTSYGLLGPKKLGEFSVGSINWDKKTGEIGWLGVDKEHRHNTAHLMVAAVQHADKHGYARPLWAGELSDFSNKLSDKYAPEYKRSAAKVEGRTIDEWQDAHHALLSAKSIVNDAVASAHQEFGHRPGYSTNLQHLNDLAKETHSHIDDAVRGISSGKYEDARYGIISADDAAHGLHMHVKNMGGYHSGDHAFEASQALQSIHPDNFA